ncbi:MAG: 30S ribosome-binding factor RbfA [Sandaracinaceae bacterium]|jgi:ribosome-binding factor A|nr:30S ribosome-binding factor RbfA [Sandaracinaceae bacterium]
MANEAVKRAVRIADRIRAELEDVLHRGIVRDPAAQGAVISSVKVTDDLRLATVYVRCLTGAEVPRQKNLVRAMERAKGVMRRELSTRMQLRYTPELKFFWDEGADHALRMDTLFDEIAKEKKGPA